MTFESDKFSEYAIGTAKTASVNEKDSMKEEIKEEVKEEAPKTSDYDFRFWIMAACSSFILCITVLTKEFNKKTNKK